MFINYLKCTPTQIIIFAAVIKHKLQKSLPCVITLLFEQISFHVGC